MDNPFRRKPQRYAQFWFSFARGIHGGVTHAVWCVSRDACEQVTLPVDRHGRITIEKRAK